MTEPKRKLPIALMTVGSPEWHYEQQQLQQRESQRHRALVVLAVVIGACIYAIVALCMNQL